MHQVGYIRVLVHVAIPPAPFSPASVDQSLFLKGLRVYTQSAYDFSHLIVDIPNSQVEPTSKSNILYGRRIRILRRISRGNQPPSFQKNSNTRRDIPNTVSADQILKSGKRKHTTPNTPPPTKYQTSP